MFFYSDFDRVEPIKVFDFSLRGQVWKISHLLTPQVKEIIVLGFWLLARFFFCPLSSVLTTSRKKVGPSQDVLAGHSWDMAVRCPDMARTWPIHGWDVARTWSGHGRDVSRIWLGRG